MLSMYSSSASTSPGIGAYKEARYTQQHEQEREAQPRLESALWAWSRRLQTMKVRSMPNQVGNSPLGAQLVVFLGQLLGALVASLEH